MRRPEFIARQASNPSGLLGRLLFRLMAAETLAVNERRSSCWRPNRALEYSKLGLGTAERWCGQLSWCHEDSWQHRHFGGYDPDVPEPQQASHCSESNRSEARKQ